MSDVDWKQDEVMMFGKKIVTKREVAWYAETELVYEYSKIKRTAKLFTKDLVELKGVVEKITGATFNSCLLNLYHNGEEGMGWHSDSEDTLVRDASIASLSFGANRKMSFKHKVSKELIQVVLESGSLLLMGKGSQDHWWHSIPKSKRVSKSRISLTFRLMK